MTYLYNIDNPEEYVKDYPGMTITHPDGYPYIDIIVIDVDEMPKESVIRWLDDQSEWSETECEVLHDLCRKLGVDDNPETNEDDEEKTPPDLNDILDACR